MPAGEQHAQPRPPSASPPPLLTSRNTAMLRPARAGRGSTHWSHQSTPSSGHSRPACFKAPLPGATGRRVQASHPSARPAKARRRRRRRAGLCRRAGGQSSKAGAAGTARTKRGGGVGEEHGGADAHGGVVEDLGRLDEGKGDEEEGKAAGRNVVERGHRVELQAAALRAGAGRGWWAGARWVGEWVRGADRGGACEYGKHGARAGAGSPAHRPPAPAPLPPRAQP